MELHTGSWSWYTLVLRGGRWGCPSPLLPQAGLPHPGGLTVPNPPLGSEPGLVLLRGCGDASSVPWPMVAVTTGLSWPLPLSFWGPVAPPRSLSCGTCVAGGVRALLLPAEAGAVASLVELPPHLIFFFFFFLVR